MVKTMEGRLKPIAFNLLDARPSQVRIWRGIVLARSGSRGALPCAPYVAFWKRVAIRTAFPHRPGRLMSVSPSLGSGSRPLSPTLAETGPIGRSLFP